MRLVVEVSCSLVPALMPLLARLRQLFDLDVEPLAIVLARVKILPIDDEQALRAGDILAELVSDLVVVTRNVKHLGRIRGLSVSREPSEAPAR